MHTLTIFYTQDIGGELAQLPQLYTFIQHLKQQYDKRALLLDLGGACNDTIWHCRATQGRSSLLVLDSMGYHAVNISAYLDDAQRASLRNTLTVGMVSARHRWRYHVPPHRDEDIIVAGIATPALKLCIVATPAEQTRLENRLLTLQAVPQGSVGRAQIDLQALHIRETTQHQMPRGLRPHATIAATVELVEDEARQAQERNNR